jgi:hypothetical protein
MITRHRVGFSFTIRRGARPAAGSIRRRARATVLLGVAAIILAQVGLAVAVESRRPEWRDPEFFHRRKNLNAMAKWSAETGQPRSLVVILGTSRSVMGLSPGHLGFGHGPCAPLACHCSQTGCMPIDQRLNLGRVLDAGLTPDFVLVEVLPPVLADPRPVGEQVKVNRLGTADLVRLRPYLADPSPVVTRWASGRAAGWYTFRFDLLAHAGQGDLIPASVRQDFLWNTLPADGWGPFSPGEWPTDAWARGIARARGQYAWLLADFRVNPESARAHRELLAECRARGIRAALFVMPESPTFRGWYPPAARDAVRDYLAGLSAAFGAPVFDASAWIDDEAAFLDGHHLFGPEAVRFSERFGRECVGPWVRG